MSERIVEERTEAVISREAVEAISARTGEPVWMREQRLAAWGVYESLPLPDPTQEEWRRTDISGLRLDALRALVDGTGPVAAALPPRAAAPSGGGGRAGPLPPRGGGPAPHRPGEG